MSLTRWFIAALFATLLGVGLTLPMRAQTVVNLYSFSGSNSSGNPGLVVPTQGRDGKLYGTTVGPSGSAGSIFKITTTGKATQPFTFGSDGTNPWDSLTLGSDGNFYGTTSAGGASGNGVLFKISPSGSYTTLHEFSGGSDGASPFAAPIQASDSNFYGVTFGTNGASTIYRLMRDGTFTTIYNFDNTTGQQVITPLIQGSDGNLYGTASFGGTSNCGTIFKVSTAGVVLWSYSFPCGAGGAFPEAPLLQASDGNYYGTTLEGGNSLGFGTVFKLDQSGTVSILYTFKNFQDGGNPEAGLTQGTDGNLYGTTLGGGRNSQGTLFKLTLAGVHTILYNFGQVGQQPFAAPMQHTNGMFYGTTNVGGQFKSGTVYSLNMGLGAFVTFVRPTGNVGQTAQILGQGLTGTTSVTFNGLAATSFRVVSDTYMTAVIPSGATTGPVVVTTPTGTLTSNRNFIIPGTASRTPRTK